MAVPYTFGTATSSIPLSQLDSNFATVITLGNTAIQLGNTVTTLNNMTLANVTISSGNVTITNVTITTANVTTANIGTAFVSGNVSFTGTSNRITGDFSNATVASNLIFQTSTVNGGSYVRVMPNGTASVSGFQAYASGTDPGNTSNFQIRIGLDNNQCILYSNRTGTGTYLPMTLNTSGSDKLTIAADATGTYTFGGTAPRITGDFSNATASNRVIFQTSTANANTRIGMMPNSASTGTAGPVLYSTNDPNNASVFDIRITDGVQASLISTFNGTGTNLPMTFSTGGSEAMRIAVDAGGIRAVGIGYTTLTGVGDNGLAVLGNVGIGTSSPAYPLQVRRSGGAGSVGITIDNVAGVANRTTQYFAVGDSTSDTTGHAFYTRAATASDVLRLAIDSDGNLLVGATSLGGSERLNVTKDNNGQEVIRVVNTSSVGPWGMDTFYSAAAPNGTSNNFISCRDTGGAKFDVRSNGGVANYSANNVNLSDRREKTNFAPAKSYLGTICAIPVQTFNYIDQNLEEDGGLTLGVVAQDVQAVAPELVMESNWASKDEEPKMRLSIYQTDLQYALMKCIQEQQALITSLTARITALEST